VKKLIYSLIARVHYHKSVELLCIHGFYTHHLGSMTDAIRSEYDKLWTSCSRMLAFFTCTNSYGFAPRI